MTNIHGVIFSGMVTSEIRHWLVSCSPSSSHLAANMGNKQDTGGSRDQKLGQAWQPANNLTAGPGVVSN